MKNWESIYYQRIRLANVKDGNLIVVFENDDEITIALNRLLDPDQEIEIPVKISNSEYDITIASTPEDIIIPWDRLRVLTDLEYAKSRAQIAENHAKKIGLKIKNLRQKLGVQSQELAERAGITPQTITRIEKGYTDINFSTLNKLLGALGLSLKDLADSQQQISPVKDFNAILNKLSKIGIKPEFVLSKIIPPHLVEALEKYNVKNPGLLLNEAANYICQIFGWPLDSLYKKEELSLDNLPASEVFYKLPKNSSSNQIKAYSYYAYYISKAVAKSYNKKPEISYPESTEEFITQYYSLYKILNLDNLVEYAWKLGICVVPLNDPGVFHGACWSVEGKNIIVLKQSNLSHSRWIFDFLHELYHVFAHLNEENISVIEEEEITPFTNNNQGEREANAFANQVLLGSNNIKLADECISEAKWDIKNLKRAVFSVAKKNNIREDALANHIAYRLSLQGENWWSTANSIQLTDPSPFTILYGKLMQKIDVNLLTNFEYNVLNVIPDNYE